MLTSYPRDAFGDLTPTCARATADADSGGVVSPGVRPRPRLARDRPRHPPATARRRPHGAARLEPREGRAVRRAHPGPEPRGRPAGPGRRRRPARRPSPCSSRPPPGVQPGMVGTILDEEVNLVDITSTLVDLAVRGHLQIARDDQGVFRADDWVLTRTAPPATAVRARPLRAAAPRLGLRRRRPHRAVAAEEPLQADPGCRASGSCTRRSCSVGGSVAAPSDSAPAGSASAPSCSPPSVVFAFFGAGAAVGALPGRRVRRSTRRGCSSAGGVVSGPADPVARQADGGTHRAGVGDPRAVPRLRAVHRDRRGQPDPVGGGAGPLQPLPALRHRLRPRRPLGPGLRGGRRGRRGSGPRRRRPRPGTSATGPPAASPTSRRAWTRSPRSRPAPSSRRRAPRARAASAAAGASPAAVAAGRPAAAGSRHPTGVTGLATDEGPRPAAAGAWPSWVDPVSS